MDFAASQHIMDNCTTVIFILTLARSEYLPSPKQQSFLHINLENISKDVTMPNRHCLYRSTYRTCFVFCESKTTLALHSRLYHTSRRQIPCSNLQFLSVNISRSHHALSTLSLPNYASNSSTRCPTYSSSFYISLPCKFSPPSSNLASLTFAS